MTVVEPPVSLHSDSECHAERCKASADHTEPLVPAEPDGVGHNVSSNSKDNSDSPSNQTSPEASHHPPPSSIFHQYSCVLPVPVNETKYSGLEIQPIIVNDESSPIDVSIPQLEIHGLAYRSEDGCRSQKTSQSATKAQESPMGQGNEQTTEGGGQLEHARGANEVGDPIVKTMVLVTGLIHVVLIYLAWRFVDYTLAQKQR